MSNCILGISFLLIISGCNAIKNIRPGIYDYANLTIDHWHNDGQPISDDQYMHFSEQYRCCDFVLSTDGKWLLYYVNSSCIN